MVERQLRESEVPGSNPGLSDFFGAVFTMLQCATSDRGVLNPDTRKDNVGSPRNWIAKKALYKMIYHQETGLLRRPYTR